MRRVKRGNDERIGRMKPKKIIRQNDEFGDASERKGLLKAVGGSMSDAFNIDLVNQSTRTLWCFKNADAEENKAMRRSMI
jgi:hypothetical protein